MALDQSSRSTITQYYYTYPDLSLLIRNRGLIVIGSVEEKTRVTIIHFFFFKLQISSPCCVFSFLSVTFFFSSPSSPPYDSSLLSLFPSLSLFLSASHLQKLLKYISAYNDTFSFNIFLRLFLSFTWWFLCGIIWLARVFLC